MTEQVYKLLYCSRNHIGGTPEQQRSEVERILASSRRNNVRQGLTGALLFNGDWFAQVLEGSLQAVEAAFERIQRDDRHSDVTLLESGYVAGRDFGEWSMAYAGADEDRSWMEEFQFDKAMENPSAAALEVQALLRDLLLQGAA